MNIDELRVDWCKQVVACDVQIACLYSQRPGGAANDDLIMPAHVWVSLLESWRRQLEDLMGLYPGQL